MLKKGSTPYVEKLWQKQDNTMKKNILKKLHFFFASTASDQQSIYKSICPDLDLL